MKIVPLIVCCLISSLALAQKTQPKGGKGAIQIIYYRIDFTQEDTDYLRTHAPELIFSVNEYGKARLEKVNDIDRSSIIDSLMKMNDRLPEFYPEQVNGKNEQGVYFLRLTWPNYQLTGNSYTPTINLQYYSPRKLTDFEDITYRSPRFDMWIGGFAAGFGGNIGKNVDTGWGTKFEFMVYGKNGWGGGFGTTFIIAKSRTNDPSIPIRFQQRQMITLITGSVGKIFGERKGGEIGIQFEPGFGLTGAVNTSSDRGVALGFVPGMSLSWLMPLGKGRMVRQYFLPVAYKQYLNFHIAARQLILNAKEANGSVYELGLSYRFAQRPVLNYKLKDSAN